MSDIDTFNKFFVGVKGFHVVIGNPPQLPISADDAMLLAAYLVAIAEHMAKNSFQLVLDAVKNT